MNTQEFSSALFITKKNLLRNKGSLLFTVLIISLGFISSLVVYGVLQDTSYDMQENYIETSLGHIVLEPYVVGSRIERVDNVLKKIKIIPDVLGVASVSKRPARLLDDANNSVDTEVLIISPEEFSSVSLLDSLVTDGSWLREGDSGKIVVGCLNIKQCNSIPAFNRLDSSVGDKVTVFSSSLVNSEVILGGIFDHMFLDVEYSSYVTRDTASWLFSDYDASSADMIIIRLPSRESTLDVINELSHLGIKLKITGWEEKTSRYSSIIDSFLVIGDLSFLIGVCISAISIYVILYINILNKRSQIGIMNAMGINARVISLSYVLLSFFLSVLGCVLGVLLTLLMILYFSINPLETGVGFLVPQVSFRVYVLVSLAILVASVLSGYVVSSKINKQNMIEAIHRG